MKKQLFFAIATTLAMSFASQVNAQIVINEIESDTFNTPTTDYGEFIELLSLTGATTSLSGHTLVLFNGNGDVAYQVFDLDGFSTDANGFFLFGSTSIPGAHNTTLLGAGNILQNGPDAVALYSGDFTLGALATTANLIDAVVYGTDDANDTGLLTALGETTQFNEGPNPTSDAANRSLARIPDQTGEFVLSMPTPGVANVPEPSTIALFGIAGLAGLLRLRRR